MSSSNSPIELFDPGCCPVGFLRTSTLLGMVLTRNWVCSLLRPPFCFPWLSKKSFPHPACIQFYLLKVQLLFFNSLESPYLWFIVFLEAFYFYANLGFQTIINSKIISIFYVLFHGSTATWNYSNSLFAFKAQIIYSSDFTKYKIFHVF